MRDIKSQNVAERNGTGFALQIPVTYAGGARSLADLDIVKAAGKGRVDITIGSALDIFGGDLAYRDVVDWHWKQMR